MTHTHNSTESTKGKHLTYQDRCQIAILFKEGYTLTQIGQAIGNSRQTVRNEQKRGTITQIRRQKHHGKTHEYDYEIYDADAGQAVYERHRLNCGRRPKWADSDAFVTWADEKMLQEAWSPDVVVQFAKDHELFDAAIIPCTTTLYHWIDSGIMKTKNMDLLEKLTRKTKETQKKARRNKRVLGESIENRPTSVDSRESFGHWEIDTVIGHKKQSEAALLTLVERQTRFEVILKIEGKKASAVDDALMALRQRAGDAFPHLFKTITSDNGSEFSGLNDTLSDVTDIYFAHPYASWEHGTSENQHKLIRRFIPKGQSINGLSDEQCRRIQT